MNLPYMRPERFFLLAGLLFGLFYVFAVPPFQSPDEDIHFMSAWQYSTLDTLGGFPANLVESLYRHLEAAVDKSGTVYDREMRDEFFRAEAPSDPAALTAYDTTLVRGLYSQYLVQMAAFRAAQFFSARYYCWLIAGRLANLVLFLVCGYFAVRLAKFYRWGMALLALTPMNLSLAASLSYDVSTNAVVLLFFAFLQRFILAEEKYSRREIVPLILCSLLLVFMKFPYVFMVLLLCIAPAAKFRAVKYKWMLCGFAVLCVAGGVLFNAGRTADINIDRGDDARPVYDRDSRMRISRANPAEHISVMKKSPLVFVRDFAAAYGKTLISVRLPFYAGSFIGILGWLTVWPPWWLMVFYAGVLVFASLYDPDGEAAGQRGFNVRWKWSFLVFGVGLVSLIHLIFYMAVATENGEIAGVQGKYFFPVALLFLLLPEGGGLWKKLPLLMKKNLPLFYMAAVTLTHAVYLYKVHEFFKV